MSLINRFFNAPVRPSTSLTHGPVSSMLNDPFFNDTLFNRNLVNTLAPLMQTHSTPSMDLQENEKSFMVNLNVPGFKKEDIEILAEGNTVSVKGTWNSSSAENGSKANHDHDCKANHDHDSDSNYIYKERSSGSFFRSFTLENFDASQVSAHLQDGVLQLTLPKVKVLEKTKKIEIA